MGSDTRHGEALMSQESDPDIKFFVFNFIIKI